MRDALSTESSRIVILLNLEELADHVRCMLLEEAFDVVAIDWRAAIVAPIPAQWTKRADAANAHTDHTMHSADSTSKAPDRFRKSRG